MRKGAKLGVLEKLRNRQVATKELSEGRQAYFYPNLHLSEKRKITIGA
jgi:hypothetical protein